MKLDNLIAKCNYFYKLAVHPDLQKFITKALHDPDTLEVLYDYLLENNEIKYDDKKTKSLGLNLYKHLIVADWIKENYELGDFKWINIEDIKPGDIIWEYGKGFLPVVDINMLSEYEEGGTNYKKIKFIFENGTSEINVSYPGSRYRHEVIVPK